MLYINSIILVLIDGANLLNSYKFQNYFMNRRIFILFKKFLLVGTYIPVLFLIRV